MSEMLFPQRQRCKKCRGSLGADLSPVFLGMFCTPRCAGRAEPTTDISRAPRECKTQRDGKWAWKRRYRSVEEIPDKIKQDVSTNWYVCGHCLAYHLGHSRMGEAEKFRMLTDAEDLADMLIKLRGQATHTQVAKAAGVQPIRLKELENPKKGQRVDLPTLFKVLGTLQARAGVAVKGGR